MHQTSLTWCLKGLRLLRKYWMIVNKYATWMIHPHNVYTFHKWFISALHDSLCNEVLKKDYNSEFSTIEQLYEIAWMVKEAGPSHLPPPQYEVRSSSPPKEVNLGSWIAMEVDDWEPEWLMKEDGYKPSDGPSTISKRQQCRGLGPPVEILAFTSIEDLEKYYLVCSPSYLLTPPFIERGKG